MKLGERETTQDISGNSIFTTRFMSGYENGRLIFPKGEKIKRKIACIFMVNKLKESIRDLKGCPISLCKVFGYKSIFLALEGT